jgi:prevent-host-death family protein
MRTVSIRQIRAELTRLDEVVAASGELVVTRRGKPIARVLPMRPGRAVPSHAELRASLPRLSRSSEELLREERDER